MSVYLSVSADKSTVIQKSLHVTISQRADRIFASFSVEISEEEYQRTH